MGPFPTSLPHTHSLLAAFHATSVSSDGDCPSERRNLEVYYIKGARRVSKTHVEDSSVCSLVPPEVALGTGSLMSEIEGSPSILFHTGQHHVSQLIDTDTSAPPPTPCHHPEASMSGRAISQSSFNSVFYIIIP